MDGVGYFLVEEHVNRVDEGSGREFASCCGVNLAFERRGLVLIWLDRRTCKAHLQFVGPAVAWVLSD